MAQFQPSLRDLHAAAIGFPTLKRWAIIGHPFGMTSGNSQWHWIAKLRYDEDWIRDFTHAFTITESFLSRSFF